MPFPTRLFCFYSWEPRKVGKVNEITVVNRKEEEEEKEEEERKEDEIVLIYHTSSTNLHLKQMGNHFTLCGPGIFTNDFTQVPTLKTDNSKRVLPCATP